MWLQLTSVVTSAFHYLMKENARLTQQLVRLALDIAFLSGGVFYGGRVLKRMSMTYLSEIAFPFDVRTKRREVFSAFGIDLSIVCHGL